ncbi:hypothetical protein D9M69_505430 [compost metagenome]
MNVSCFDFLLGKTNRWQQFKREIVELLIVELEHVLAEIFAKRPLVESELDVECAFQSGIQHFNLLVSKALSFECRRIDAGCLIEIAVTDSISFDFSNLAFRIAERAQCFRHSAIDDLEVTAASELLEFHQSKVRLNTGRITIHDETDRAGWRDNCCLRIAVAVLFTEFQCLVPCSARVGDHVLVRAIFSNQADRINGKAFITIIFAISRTAMIANDAEHAFGIWLIAWESTELLGHFSRSGIGNTGHDRGEGATDRTAFI